MFSKKCNLSIGMIFAIYSDQFFYVHNIWLPVVIPIF